MRRVVATKVLVRVGDRGRRARCALGQRQALPAAAGRRWRQQWRWRRRAHRDGATALPRNIMALGQLAREAEVPKLCPPTAACLRRARARWRHKNSACAAPWGSRRVATPARGTPLTAADTGPVSRAPGARCGCMAWVVLYLDGAVAGEEAVGELEVAVQHALRVQVVHSAQDLLEPVQRLLLLDRLRHGSVAPAQRLARGVISAHRSRTQEHRLAAVSAWLCTFIFYFFVPNFLRTSWGRRRAVRARDAGRGTRGASAVTLDGPRPSSPTC